MADLGNATVFSQVDDSNNSATQPGIKGSDAPSRIDNTIRALQGAVTRDWNRTNPTLTSTGSGGGYVLTYAVAPAAYYTGQEYDFIAGHASTGASTLNINALGAVAIKKDLRGTLTDVAAGDISIGQKIEVYHNGTVFVWSNVQKADPTPASTTEILTGTDTAKPATADAIAALWEKGTDVASATTISFGDGGYFHVTGTTTITDIDFATDKAGRVAYVRFAGALTLTHNATSLILPGAANIVTASGDTAAFVSEGTDNVRCLFYHRASGVAVVPSKKLVSKAADQSVASTTLANDNDFSFAVAANTNYVAQLVLDASHTSVEDFKFDFTGPASPTFVSYGLVAANGYTASANLNVSGSRLATAFSQAITVTTEDTPLGTVTISFALKNGANAGTVQFRWANNATSTSMTVSARSFMSYEIVS
jgi:hypothetical protein